MAERLVYEPWCGCKVYRIVRSKPNLYRIQYCSKHEAAPDLYEACKKTQKYFRGCLNAWANGDRVMPSNESVVRVASDDLDKLCDEAAELIEKALSKAGRKK